MPPIVDENLSLLIAHEIIMIFFSGLWWWAADTYRWQALVIVMGPFLHANDKYLSRKWFCKLIEVSFGLGVIFFSTSFTRKSLFYAIVHFGVFLNPWYTVQKTWIRSQGALHSVFWNSMHSHYHVQTAQFRLKVLCLFFTWDILHIILYIYMSTLLNSVSRAQKWWSNDSYFIKEFYGHFLWCSSLMTKVWWKCFEFRYNRPKSDIVIKLRHIQWLPHGDPIPISSMDWVRGNSLSM